MNDMPITAVNLEVPRYEYARLIRQSERLNVIKRLKNSLDVYDFNKIVEALLADEEDE